jgi:hypothetical protein
MTAPKVSRFGTRVGAAAPDDWAFGASATGVVLPGELADCEPVPEGLFELIVALLAAVVVGAIVDQWSIVADAESEAELLADVLVLDAMEDELEDDGRSTIWATMRTSEHWSPIHSLYRLPNSPLMQRHQRVEGPMAREVLSQTEKPPVYTAPA